MTKRWLHVDAHGVPSLFTPDKHEIVRELHIRWAWAPALRRPSRRPAAAAAAAAECQSAGGRPVRAHAVVVSGPPTVLRLPPARSPRSYRDLLQLDPTVPIPFPAAILIRPKVWRGGGCGAGGGKHGSGEAPAGGAPLLIDCLPAHRPRALPAPAGAGGEPGERADAHLGQPVLRAVGCGGGGGAGGCRSPPLPAEGARPADPRVPCSPMPPPRALLPVPAVPKASDPAVATFPTMDSPFVKQLCTCLREGKSTATLHDLSRHAAQRCGRGLCTALGAELRGPRRRAGGSRGLVAPRLVAPAETELLRAAPSALPCPHPAPPSRASASFDFDAPYELRALEVALATVSPLAAARGARTGVPRRRARAWACWAGQGGPQPCVREPACPLPPLPTQVTNSLDAEVWALERDAYPAVGGSGWGGGLHLSGRPRRCWGSGGCWAGSSAKVTPPWRRPACLDANGSRLARPTRAAWAPTNTATPTADRLALNVSKGVLEEVRQVKQIMGRLTGRVQRIKTELEEVRGGWVGGCAGGHGGWLSRAGG